MSLLGAKEILLIVHRRESKYGVAIGTVLLRVRGQLQLVRGVYGGGDSELCFACHCSMTSAAPARSNKGWEQTLMLMHALHPVKGDGQNQSKISCRQAYL